MPLKNPQNNPEWVVSLIFGKKKLKPEEAGAGQTAEAAQEPMPQPTEKIEAQPPAETPPEAQPPTTSPATSMESDDEMLSELAKHVPPAEKPAQPPKRETPAEAQPETPAEYSPPQEELPPAEAQPLPAEQPPEAQPSATAQPEAPSQEPFTEIEETEDEEVDDLKEKISVSERVGAPREFSEYCTFEPPPGYQELERYWVAKPFVWSAVLYSPERNERMYFLVEPSLTPGEKTALQLLHDHLLDRLTYDEKVKDKDKMISMKMIEILREYGVALQQKSVKKLFYYLKRNYVGYGKLDGIFRDPNIEDISCDGLNVPIFVYSRRYQSLRTNLVFTDTNELDLFTIRLVEKAGKQISLGKPTIDAALPEGYRLQATLGTEITTRGSSFSIRKYAEEPFTPVDILTHGTFSIEMLAYLWLATENKKNLIIVGGTASGKTSTLNALSMFIWPDAKIVSIEDTRELALYQSNWVPSIVRPGAGDRSIDMYDLLRQALRQRPEVIIVGEVRGKEALTMFQAMSSVGKETPILVQASQPKLTPIGEFVDSYYERDEEGPKPISGAKVLTVRDGKVVFDPIKYILRHKVQEIHKIRYQGGTIEATGSHSIFTIDDFGNIVCRRASELKVGDHLITFKKSGSEGVPQHAEIMQGKRRARKH
ncbi:MAG: ATPase, T2SS/T4P/T4SS family, partial [Candidatus Hadarchaeota archaeon]